MTRASRTILAGVAAIAAALLAGCGQRTVEARSLPVGHVDIPGDAIVWAQGSTLHVDDRQVDVGGQVDELAVVRGGVYFVRDGTVWFTDLDRVERTALGVYRGLSTTADHRYLGLLDFDNGPKDGYGTRRAAVVVVDTTTGREVVRDETLMGDLEKDDLADLYEDAEPRVVGLDDDNVYAQTAEGGEVLRYPLDGGKPENLGQQAEPVVFDPAGPSVGTKVRDGVLTTYAGFEDGSSLGRVSPSGRTVLVGAFSDDFRPYDATTRRPLALTLDAPRFALGAWTGPDSFYGVAMTRGRHPAAIVSCDREQPQCTEVVPATALSDEPVVTPGAAGI